MGRTFPLVRGGDCVDAFWKTGCFGAESARVNGLLEEEGELSRE